MTHTQFSGRSFSEFFILLRGVSISRCISSYFLVFSCIKKFKFYRIKKINAMVGLMEKREKEWDRSEKNNNVSLFKKILNKGN